MTHLIVLLTNHLLAGRLQVLLLTHHLLVTRLLMPLGWVVQAGGKASLQSLIGIALAISCGHVVAGVVARVCRVAGGSAKGRRVVCIARLIAGRVVKAWGTGRGVLKQSVAGVFIGRSTA